MISHLRVRKQKVLEVFRSKANEMEPKSRSLFLEYLYNIEKEPMAFEKQQGEK